MTKSSDKATSMKQHLHYRLGGLSLAASLLIGLGVATGAQAATSTFLMDFNTARSSSNYPTAHPSAEWMTFAAPANVTGTLIDSVGSASLGISVAHTGDFTDSTGTGLYNANMAPAWTRGVAPADDFFWTGSDPDNVKTFTLTFGGFSVGDTVSLDLFASRDSANSITGYYEFSLDGGSTWGGFTVLDVNGAVDTANGWGTKNTQTQLFDIDNDGYTLGRSMSIAGAVLADTSLLVKVTKPVGSSYTGLNSARLMVTSIPEPSTTTAAVAMTLAGMGLWVRRRGVRASHDRA